MPESIIIKNGHKPDSKCAKPTETFTGDVYLDPIRFNTEAAIANVTFTSCARTHWHTHEKGQMTKVVAGSGWICDRGGVPKRLMTGDVVWAPAGTTRWHGADDGSIMTRFVVGLGRTMWHEAVTDEEYGRKGGVYDDVSIGRRYRYDIEKVSTRWFRILSQKSPKSLHNHHLLP